MKQYTSNNNSTKGIVYSARNEYEYDTTDNHALSVAVWAIFVIIIMSIVLAFGSVITVKADSIGYADSAYTVPTSLCHDPLLGPSMIIYTDCGTSTEDYKNKDTDILHGVNIITEVVLTSDIVTPVAPEVVIIPEDDTEEPVQVTVDAPVKGNNGHGNNVDGCDSSNPSGKCPKKGTDTSAPIDDEKKVK